MIVRVGRTRHQSRRKLHRCYFQVAKSREPCDSDNLDLKASSSTPLNQSTPPPSLRSQALLCVVKKPQSKLVAVHLSPSLSPLHAVIFNLLEIPSSQRGLFSSPLLSSPLHWQMVLKIRLLEEEPLHWPDCSMVTYCLKPCGAAAAAASAASECEAARLRRRWRRRASLWWNRRRASSFIERRRVASSALRVLGAPWLQ